MSYDDEDGVKDEVEPGEGTMDPGGEESETDFANDEEEKGI